MSVVDRMRGKTVLPPSPRRKYQSLVEIVEKLNELPSPTEASPTGNMTPELAPATAASPPPTPSDWDYDDEPPNGPNTHPFPYPIQTQGRFIGWSRDSTMYAPLLHPYAPSSPESAHMLSAIHVPRPLRASTSSLATHLEEVSSVVDHGDHHEPTHDAQSHGDLLGRAAAPMNHRQVSTESDHPRLSRDEHLRTQLPRLRGRSRSCPPGGPTRHVQPPHTSQELPAPPLRRPTPPPPPRHYEDVAVQTENFVDVEVQTDIVDWRTSPQDTAAQTSAVAHPPTTDIVGATQGITVTPSTDAPSNTADVAATGVGKELVNSPVDLTETKASPQATSTQDASSGPPQAGPSTVEQPPVAQDAASPSLNTTSGSGASKSKETNPVEPAQQSASTPDATSSTAKSTKKPPVTKKNTSQTAQDKVSNSPAANSERSQGTSKSTSPTPKNATPPTTRQNSSSSGTKAKGRSKDSAPATPSTTKAAEEKPSTPVDTTAAKAARNPQGAVDSSQDTTIVKEKTTKPESKHEESKILASSTPAPPTLSVDETTSSTGATSGRDEQMLVPASDQTTQTTTDQMTKTTTDQTVAKESKPVLTSVVSALFPFVKISLTDLVQLNESPVADSQSSNDVNIEMKDIAAKEQSSEAQSEGAARSEPPSTEPSGPSPLEPTTTSAKASSPEIPGAFPNITTSTTTTTTQPAPKATRNAWGSANKVQGLKLDTSGPGIRYEPVQANLPLGRSSTLSSAAVNRSGPAPLPVPPQGGQSHLRSASMNDGAATQSLVTPSSGANGGSNGNGGRPGMDRSASASFSGSGFGRAGGGLPSSGGRLQGGSQSVDASRGHNYVLPSVTSSTPTSQRPIGFGSHAPEKPKPAATGWFGGVGSYVSNLLISPSSTPNTPSPAAAESPTRSSSLPPSAAGSRAERVDTNSYAGPLERNLSPLNPAVTSFVPTSQGSGNGGSTAGPTTPNTSVSKWAPTKQRQSQASTEGSRAGTKPSSPVIKPLITPSPKFGSASDDPKKSHTTPVVSPDPVTNEPKQSVDIVENKEPTSKPLDTDAPSPAVPLPDKESSTAGPVDVVPLTPAANATSSDVPPSSKVVDTDSLVLAPQGESSTAGVSKEVERTNDASSTADVSKEADKTSDPSAAKDKELPPEPSSSENVEQTALAGTTKVQDPASQPLTSSDAVVESQGSGSVHEDASDATKAGSTTSTSADQGPAPQLSVDTVLADNTSSPPPPVAGAAQLNSEEASWDHVKHEEANLTDTVVLAEPIQKPEEGGGEVHATEEQSHETEGYVDVGASTGKLPLSKLATTIAPDGTEEGSTPTVDTVSTPGPRGESSDPSFKEVTHDELMKMRSKDRSKYKKRYAKVFGQPYPEPTDGSQSQAQND